MLRIITDFVPVPVIMAMCDERTCGCYATANVEPPQTIQEAVLGFIECRALEGWQMLVTHHLCPAHVKKLKDQQSMIVVPKSSFSMSS
jgi:hypothetical protein